MKPFYDPQTFPALSALAERWQEIRAEYDALCSEAEPWPEPIHNGKWSVIGMRFQDEDLERRARAPITAALCDAIPGIHTYGFSVMQPGCSITPHYGYTDKVLRAHLGLYTNDQCALNVMGEQRTWKDGEWIVFDDSLCHAAWNKGDTVRVILLLDILKDGYDHNSF